MILTLPGVWYEGAVQNKTVKIKVCCKEHMPCAFMWVVQAMRKERLILSDHMKYPVARWRFELGLNQVLLELSTPDSCPPPFSFIPDHELCALRSEVCLVWPPACHYQGSVCRVSRYSIVWLTTFQWNPIHINWAQIYIYQILMKQVGLRGKVRWWWMGRLLDYIIHQ